MLNLPEATTCVASVSAARILGRNSSYVHPEAPDVQFFADEVTLWQMDRQATQPRIADKMSARRERTCDRRCRWTAHGIKAEGYWHSAGCALNLFREFWRFDTDEFGYQVSF